ncbi:hypothetical protein M2146_001176 [Lachnospiraceae bacterium PF1-22]
MNLLNRIKAMALPTFLVVGTVALISMTAYAAQNNLFIKEEIIIINETLETSSCPESIAFALDTFSNDVLQVIREETEAKRQAEQEAQKAQEALQIQQTMRTDGFNFNGYHFDLRWCDLYNGETLYADSFVYRYPSIPNHFLVERLGECGQYIRQLGIGSTLIVEGREYTVYSIESHNYYEFEYLDTFAAYVNQYPGISFSTCDGPGDMELYWFAM